LRLKHSTRPVDAAECARSLDGNILISALLSPRWAPAQLLTRWLAGEFEVVVSEALLNELERALGYPKLLSRIPPIEAKRFVGTLRRAAEVATDDQNPAPRSLDPDDDYLLALAERSSAVMVSGDRHLLELADRLPVHTAQEFLQALDEAARAERR
jgi:putative PIN family toxin of toxin-antitoxin system